MTDPPTPPSGRSARGSDELVDLLHARGQRVTPQRLVILRELRRLGRHCTAEEIRAAVADELPGTSAPTVYATLELLVELGLVRRIDAGMAAARYDPRVEPHQHTACRRCGLVNDLEVTLDEARLLRTAAAAGFHPRAAELVISGLCASCARAA